MEEIVKENLYERKKIRMSRYNDAVQSYDYSKYQSKFLDKVLEQDALAVEEKER